jgi:hypothetical protein
VERSVHDSGLGGSYVALTVTRGCSILESDTFEESPFLRDNGLNSGKPISDVNFVPYYFRANRGGKTTENMSLLYITHAEPLARSSLEQEPRQ